MPIPLRFRSALLLPAGLLAAAGLWTVSTPTAAQTVQTVQTVQTTQTTQTTQSAQATRATQGTQATQITQTAQTVRVAPDSLVSLIAAAGDSSDWPESEFVSVFDRTEVRIEHSGMGHVYHHVLDKILSEDGARSRSVLRFDYDPASNLIRIDSVRILKADGKVEQVDPAAAGDLPAPGDMIYWGARMMLLALPRLAVGDAIEFATYKKGFQIAYLEEGTGGTTAGPPMVSTQDVASSGVSPSVPATVHGPDDERYTPPMRGHFYDVVTFQDSHPLKEKTYRLWAPRDKPVQFAVYNGSLRSSLRFADSLLVYEWSARDVSALKEESRMPDLTDVVPKVVLATVQSWPEKSRWFFAVNDTVFAANDDIRQAVEALTSGLRDEDEKMAVLLHWVAQEIRYSGLSMGKGEGYTLHPGIMTYEDRCGVCKDIAGMLVTMLRAAGFTTYPVMTMAGARVEAVPADQFNHCVVAVERKDGSYTMLDPTWAPNDRATWSRYEGEQNYVIGSPRGEGLTHIRSFRAEESRLTCEGTSRLDSDGTLRGDLRFTGRGASDARLRGYLSDMPAGERAAGMADLLSPLGPDVQIQQFEVTEARDFSKDAAWHIRYAVPGYAVMGDSVLAFAPPALRLAASSARMTRLLSFTEEERKAPALLWYSQEVVVHDRLSLPSGFRREATTDTVRCERETGRVRGRCRLEKGEFVTDATFANTERTVPPEHWKGGVEAADSLRAFGARLRWARRTR